MATPVQSIDRILDLVEILSENPGGLILSDLAAKSGLHTSTTHRLLASLVTRGYAVKNPDTGRYRLTLRIFEVGSRVANSSNLLTVSRPILERLQHSTNETVHLVVPDGSDVVYLYKESDGNMDLRMGSTVGLRAPMYCTGVGKSILASLTDDKFSAIWKTFQITKFTQTTITTEEQMKLECARIRALGYATDRQEHEEGVCCVATVIKNCFGRPIAAISISLPSFRFTEEKKSTLSKLIMEAAKEISINMGSI